MKLTNIRSIKICPRCGNIYSAPSALSRADNETLICPECGTWEALESIGVDKAEQEQIIHTIHRHTESRSG